MNRWAADRRYRAALTAVVEPGDVALGRCLAAEGSAVGLAALRAEDKELDSSGARKARAHDVDGADVLDRGVACGLRFIIPGDPEWPPGLSVLDDSLAMSDPVVPPIGLWVRGDADLAAITDGAVAIVGARAATQYGERAASNLAADLSGEGWSVVSGGAYGIDAAAHRGALAVGESTLAVLACGADIAYPRAHAELLDRIAATGVVVSELAPGARPAKSRFLLRNRLIAGMTSGVVVVEAARRSGALNTANWADRLGRGVGAVPGPITSSLSAGCHALVRERGATLVTDVDDVRELVGGWHPETGNSRKAPDGHDSSGSGGSR